VASPARCSFRLILDPYGFDEAGIQKEGRTRVEHVQAQREADVFGRGGFLYLDCGFPVVRESNLMLGVKCDNRESVHGPKKVALTPNSGLEKYPYPLRRVR
jgi:hypothetical protein